MKEELTNDPRISKVDHGDFMSNFRDYQKWVRENPTLSKFELYARNQILDHVVGIRVFKLKQEIRERYNLSQRNTKLLTDFLISDCKFCEIEKNGETKQDRYVVYRYPRKKQVTMPKPIFKSGFIKLSQQNVVA